MELDQDPDDVQTEVEPAGGIWGVIRQMLDSVLGRTPEAGQTLNTTVSDIDTSDVTAKGRRTYAHGTATSTRTFTITNSNRNKG